MSSSSAPPPAQGYAQLDLEYLRRETPYPVWELSQHSPCHGTAVTWKTSGSSSLPPASPGCSHPQHRQPGKSAKEPPHSSELESVWSFCKSLPAPRAAYAENDRAGAKGEGAGSAQDSNSLPATLRETLPCPSDSGTSHTHQKVPPRVLHPARMLIHSKLLLK